MVSVKYERLFNYKQITIVGQIIPPAVQTHKVPQQGYHQHTKFVARTGIHYHSQGKNIKQRVKMIALLENLSKLRRANVYSQRSQSSAAAPPALIRHLLAKIIIRKRASTLDTARQKQKYRQVNYSVIQRAWLIFIFINTSPCISTNY